MNKKFTTLVAALLLSSAAFADVTFSNFNADVKIQNGLKVYLADAETPETGFLAPLAVEKDGKVVGYTLQGKAESSEADLQYFVVADVKKELGGYTFQLKDERGNIITLKNDGAVATAEDLAQGVTKFFVDNEKVASIQKIQVISPSANTSNKLCIGGSNAYGYEEEVGNNKGIEMYTASAEVQTSALLNQAFAGEGFSFVFDKEVEGNVFGQKVYAVNIPASSNGSIANVAGGLYLTTSGGKELAAAIAASSNADDEAVIKAFNEATFIVLDGTDSWGIEALKTNAEGLKFATVKGENLSIARDNSGLALKGEGKKKHHVNNALFTITESDPLNGTNKFSLKVGKSSGTYYVSDAAANDGAGTFSAVGEMNVIAYQPMGESKVYLTSGTAATYAAVASFTNESWASASALIKEGKNVVSIYNVDGTNKAKYVIATDGSTLAVKSAKEMETENVIAGQWIATNYFNNVFTLTNRLTGAAVNLSLYGTDNANEYKVASSDKTTEIPVGSVLRFDAQKVDKFDGSANFDANFLKGTYQLVFNYTGEEKNPVAGEVLYMGAVSVNDYTVRPTKGDITWNLAATKDTIQLTTDFAYLDKDGKVAIKEAGDTLAVMTYNLKNGEITLGTTNNKLVNNKATTNAYDVEYFFLTNGDGTYSMKQNIASSAVIKTKAEFVAAKAYAVAQDGKSITNSGSSVADYNTVSFESVTPVVESPFYANFESVRGYISQNANKETGVVEGALAAEAMTFLVDTTGTTNVVYIAKKSGDEMAFMYNAKDSVKVFDEYTATEVVNPAYAMPGYTGTTDAKPMAVFQKATYAVETKDTLNVNGVLVAENANEAKGIKAGLSNFQFTLEETTEGSAEYYIKNGTDYLYSSANVLGFQNEQSGALTFTLTKVEDPTSNENVVVASEVKVIANNGSIVVKNAAGKNVVVSTILGQVVANEVLTSDNATINVPAGIVVVAVEGESFKVNVK